MPVSRNCLNWVFFPHHLIWWQQLIIGHGDIIHQLGMTPLCHIGSFTHLAGILPFSPGTEHVACEGTVGRGTVGIGDHRNSDLLQSLREREAHWKTKDLDYHLYFCKGNCSHVATASTLTDASNVQQKSNGGTTQTRLNQQKYLCVSLSTTCSKHSKHHKNLQQL